jgi:anion-transporting  ArsA/GET3 family ATPase
VTPDSVGRTSALESSASALPKLAPAIFVTGKGGVGKTTVATGLVCAAVDAGTRAVLVEFGDGASGRRALGQARDRIEHVIIDPRRAIMQAAGPVFGSPLLAKIALGNFAMKPMINSAPALRELAVLELCRKTVADNAGARVVFDMPATGHGVAWLRVAEQVGRLTRRGPLYDVCARVQEELLQPGRASIAVVTLPERLVLAETLELCQQLDEEVGLPVDRLVVNRVPTAPEPQALADAHRVASTGGEVGAAAAQLAEVLSIRSRMRAEVVSALEEVARHEHARGLTRLPMAPADPHGPEVAAWLREAGAA